VDFYYTADGAPAFAAEIYDIAARYPSLRAHVVDTTVEGRLTLDRILADIDGPPRDLSVFMCGPAGMVNSFQAGFRKAGVPARHIHREYFDWR
jgi:predicted ferric reductase